MRIAGLLKPGVDVSTAEMRGEDSAYHEARVPRRIELLEGELWSFV